MDTRQLTDDEWKRLMINLIAKDSPHDAGRAAGYDMANTVFGGLDQPRYEAQPLQVNAAGLGRDEAGRVLAQMGLGPNDAPIGPPDTQDAGPLNPPEKKGIDPAVLSAIAAQLPSGAAGIGRIADRMAGRNPGQVRYVPAGTYR